MLQKIMFSIIKSVDRVKLKEHMCLFRSIYSSTALRTNCVEKVKSFKIVFFGTDEISEVTLKALQSDRISSSCYKVVEDLDVVCIKTDCPVKRYATSHNLTTHTWPYPIPTDVYDVGIVVSFGHMIPTESILACKYGMINAHPSLLPRWRGAAPIIHSVLNGDSETGVTITQVSPNKFDVGNILMQERYNIPIGSSSKTLTNELSRLAADMVMKTLKNLPSYIESSYSQPKEGLTYARKVKPEHGCISWEKDSMSSIQRKFKAFDGFIDIYTFWKDMKMVILELTKPEDVEAANVDSLVAQPAVSPGFCYFHKKRRIVFVKCQDGWCGITSLKIPKRGKISAQDFYNGFITKEEPNKCYFLSMENKMIKK